MRDIRERMCLDVEILRRTRHGFLEVPMREQTETSTAARDGRAEIVATTSVSNPNRTRV